MKVAAYGSLAALLLLVGWLVLFDAHLGPRREDDRLVLYCAAGLLDPVKDITQDYERRFGVRVEIQPDGSGRLLSRIRTAPVGDLFLAADDSYITKARDFGLMREALAVATMQPVLGVLRGNPKSIAKLADLIRDDVVIGIAEPEAAAVGRIGKTVLTNAGMWDRVLERHKVSKTTVTDIALDIQLGAIDTAILWDATVGQRRELEAIRLPELSAHPRNITLGVLSCSKVPTRALHFARFLTARDQGLLHFERHGFRPIAGDTWADVPNIALMCGSMLNVAVDETIAAFERREGCRISREYDGCGILVSKMRASKAFIPDAYFSCDQSFLDMVEDQFEEGVQLTGNDLVLLVRAGNPKNVTSLRDLSKPGLRVGLCRPDKSALGALTERAMQRLSVRAAFEASSNWKVESPTGDYLVAQISAGSLDVVCVYRSNTAMVSKEFTVVDLGSEGLEAVQPYAIGKASDHKQLMARLLAAIRETSSIDKFTRLGFRWKDHQSR